MPNLRAALERAIEDGNFERAAVIAVGLKDFWRTRNHIAESRRLLDRVLEASEPLTRHARAPTFLGSRASWQPGRATTNRRDREWSPDRHARGDR